MRDLFITEAGMSAEKDIPTFNLPLVLNTYCRIKDYKRFATYRNNGPNDIHHW